MVGGRGWRAHSGDEALGVVSQKAPFETKPIHPSEEVDSLFPQCVGAALCSRVPGSLGIKTRDLPIAGTTS